MMFYLAALFPTRTESEVLVIVCADEALIGFGHFPQCLTFLNADRSREITPARQSTTSKHNTGDHEADPDVETPARHE